MKVFPEKQHVWLLFERGHYDKNTIVYAKPSECTITMRKPNADPLVTRVFHPEEEKIIQELPVDPDWNEKPPFLLNFNKFD